MRERKTARPARRDLLQALKLEALGRLAGGVAHDFNNLLTGILVIVEEVSAEIGPGNPRHEDLLEVLRAARKAGDLTRQLLAFGRRQVFAPVVVDLNALIAGMGPVMARFLGDGVAVRLDLDPRLGPVLADPGNIEQVLLNLGLNARDAMPLGGTLTVKTANVVLGPGCTRRHFDLKPGAYVALTVSDDGPGMTEEALAHIYEPFFTTKEGGGPGMGLAAAYGIVHQHGGDILATSGPGRGTTFQIHLPRAAKAAQAPSPEPAAAPRPVQGTETILVAEDEDIVRRITVNGLRKRGYHVLSARDAREAVAASRAHEGPVDLLLTDVIMPGMNGKALAAEIRRGRPETRVLFMSGYSKDVMTEDGILKPGTAYVEKPFSIEHLCGRVRAALDAPVPEKPAASPPPPHAGRSGPC